MTDQHNVIFHLILAGMIASLSSILIDKHSLYDHLKVQYIKDLNTIEETEKTEQVDEIDTNVHEWSECSRILSINRYCY